MSVNPTLSTRLAASAVAPVGTSFTNSAQAVLNDIQTHVASDIDPFAVVTNPTDSQVIIGGRLRLSALAIPVPTITPVGGAAGSQSYIVVAKVGLGTQQPSATVSTSVGPTTLAPTTYNTVAWPAVAGATQYDVYRSAGGSTQGLIAANLTVLTLNDTGLTGDTTTAPSASATFAASGQRDILGIALATPALVVVTQGGTAGATNYTYVVAAYDSVGQAPAAGVQTTAGNATLNGTNFNQISWNYVPGAIGYYVYRSASSGTPSTLGLIATVAQAEQASFSTTDTGQARTVAVVPTTNTTGALRVPGLVYEPGPRVGGVPVADTTAGNATITVAGMLTPLLLRSGGAGSTDTTPTAAAIVAAVAGTGIGGWFWTIRNARTGTMTLGQAATGITWVAGTNAVATVSGHTFYVSLTNVTPGSEAVSIYSVSGDVAY